MKKKLLKISCFIVDNFNRREYLPIRLQRLMKKLKKGTINGDNLGKRLIRKGVCM